MAGPLPSVHPRPALLSTLLCREESKAQRGGGTCPRSHVEVIKSLDSGAQPLLWHRGSWWLRHGLSHPWELAQMSPNG